MNPVSALECDACGRAASRDAGRFTCPVHGASRLAIEYDYDVIRAAFDGVSRDSGVSDGPSAGPATSMWRYEAFLPVESVRVSLGAGGTSLLPAPALSADLDVRIRLKDETGNPTGSIKDRGSAIVVNRALAAGRDAVACASTGNAAASIAGYAARADLECRIFVPADAPEGKVLQPLVYGADVYAVEGTYDDAYELCRTVSEDRRWYDRSVGASPFALEGTRTVGHELAEATTDDPPDWVVVSMGNGSTIAGAWKGLAEFTRLGYVEDTPRLLGVQAVSASPIHDRFRARDGQRRSRDGRASDGREGTDDDGLDPQDGHEVTAGNDTRADSIAVGRPHDARRACRAIEASGGTTVAVTDDAILRAQADLGDHEGIYAEPAAAAPLAGVRRAIEERVIERGADVVLVVTGTGLKDAESARSIAGDRRTVPPDPDALDDH